MASIRFMVHLAMACALVAGAWALPVVATAQEQPTQAPATSLPQILEQQRALAAALDGKDLDLTPRERNQVRRAQAQVFDITEGHDALEQLGIAEKVRLENALEQINALIAGGRRADEDREICRHERATGSSIRSASCGTRAERDQAREGARGYLERPRICNPPGCGS